MELWRKFEQGKERHTYQRIDSEYRVNIFLGYNENGNMSMVLTEPGQSLKQISREQPRNRGHSKQTTGLAGFEN